MKSKKMVKNVVLLMALTLLSKFLGFFRELVMSYCYGASTHSDAYFTAYDIPQVLFSLIATAIATTFIPLFYKARDNEGEEGAIDFTNNVISITLLFGIVISIFAFIFMEKIVNIFAIGFKGEVLAETVLFARIMLMGYIFSGLSSIMSSFLQSNEEFFIPGIIGIPFNFVVIASMITSFVTKNIYILPVGASIALFSQFIVQVPKAVKLGYKPKLKLDFKDKYIKEMLMLVLPVLVSTSVSQINKVVDRTLASTLEVGSLSSLNYSNKLMGFFIGLFISTIGVVIYPKLSELSNKKEKGEFNRLIKESMNVVIILMIPITFVCIVMAEPIIRTLFMRGAFDERAVYLTKNALIFYSVGMIGLSMRTVVTKIYYSIGDTTTPMTNSTIAVVLNIILSLILVRPMQNGGLAFATSISYLTSMSMLIYNLKGKIGDFGLKYIKTTLFKVIIASAAASLVIKFGYDIIFSFVEYSKIVNLIIFVVTSAIGVVVYFVVAKILKIDEIQVLMDELKKILSKFRKKSVN